MGRSYDPSHDNFCVVRSWSKSLGALNLPGTSMFFLVKRFFARNRGDSGQHAQQRGHPRRHGRRVKTTGAGKIHHEKELGEKYQNLLYILSFVSGKMF